MYDYVNSLIQTYGKPFWHLILKTHVFSYCLLYVLATSIYSIRY